LLRPPQVQHQRLGPHLTLLERLRHALGGLWWASTNELGEPSEFCAVMHGPIAGPSGARKSNFPIIGCSMKARARRVADGRSRCVGRTVLYFDPPRFDLAPCVVEAQEPTCVQAFLPAWSRLRAGGTGTWWRWRGRLSCSAAVGERHRAAAGAHAATNRIPLVHLFKEQCVQYPFAVDRTIHCPIFVGWQGLLLRSLCPTLGTHVSSPPTF
jgi:hypothetical protein